MSAQPVTLSNCDREPIHIPGAIQPHGVLLAFEPTSLQITYASANASEQLGIPRGDWLGAHASELFDGALVDLFGRNRARETTKLSAAGKTWDAIVHRAPTGEIVLELEPNSGHDLAQGFDGFYRLVRSAAERLQSTERIADLFSVAAREVRALTGFDRVMVYRFDREWNGEVLAEDKRDDLEPFLGLHYPASDIPVQARRLYELNWLRLIVDVAYTPVGVQSKNERPIDLSFATLRSVSPIHIEYLRNMGVGASMSVSLVHEGKLWGLIACHHYSGAKFVPYDVRSACEFLGQALSSQVVTRERAIRFEHLSLARERQAAIIARLALRTNLADELVSNDLLALVDAQGAAAYIDGQLRTTGETPSTDEIVRIAEWLARDVHEPVFSTDRLGDIVPELAGFTAASGLLAVALSRDDRAFLMWFRPEVAQTVDWAGDPRKSAMGDAGAERLSPRGSFKLWRENTKGRSLPWTDWQIEIAASLRSVMMEQVIRRAHELAKLNRQLEASLRAKDVFLATVSHELRTPLSAILGFASILERDTSNERSHKAATVIRRSAQTQARLIDDLLDVARIIGGKLRLDVAQVDVSQIVERALETVGHAAEAKSIKIQSIIDPNAGVVHGDPARLQQIVWNLLSNAVKFTPKQGRVQVVVKRKHSNVEIIVEDNGEGIDATSIGAIFERFRQEDEGTTRRHGGLGLGLAIVRHLVELHGGTIQVRSEGKGHGATFTVTLPIASVAVPDSDSGQRAPDLIHERLDGVRVVVVDDEDDTRSFVEELLRSQGAVVTAVSNARAALDAVAHERPDVLISDVGMPDMDGHALIRELRKRGPDEGGATPAIALTAYARPEDRARALRAGFSMYLSKPVDPDELLTVTASLTGRLTPT